MIRWVGVGCLLVILSWSVYLDYSKQEVAPVVNVQVDATKTVFSPTEYCYVSDGFLICKLVEKE